MDEEIKEIPDGGSRKKYAYIIFWIASVFSVLIIISIFNGDVDKNKLDMIMLVFDGWIAISGSVLGIYTLSETAKKHSYAVLNK